MTGNDVVPEVLWSPSKERIARAAITDFADFVSDRTGRTFDDYAALWDYSTGEPANFWGAIADYFQVRWHEQPTEVLPDVSMPGARWFPGGTLNYAEHALAEPAEPVAGEPAIIAVAEDGS